jgi:hypothetical protein
MTATRCKSTAMKFRLLWPQGKKLPGVTAALLKGVVAVETEVVEAIAVAAVVEVALGETEVAVVVVA